MAIPIVTECDKAGIIQIFEFTFEQAWKAIQKRAMVDGIEIASPKRAFSYVMENQWISTLDEGTCLELIRDRNLTSHTYEKQLAEELLDRIQKKYVILFEKILKSMEINI